MELSVDQQYIREQLKEQGLVAFVADKAVLPRESGVSAKPMKGAVPFASPESMKVTMAFTIRRQNYRYGHQKRNHLDCGWWLSRKIYPSKSAGNGVYPHIAGDGREYVITESDAVKIRAEDGRSIKDTDISMFINDLPNGKDTKTIFHGGCQWKYIPGGKCGGGHGGWRCSASH